MTIGVEPLDFSLFVNVTIARYPVNMTPGGVWTNQKLKGTFDHLIKFSAIFKNYQQESEFDGVILIYSNPY